MRNSTRSVTPKPLSEKAVTSPPVSAKVAKWMAQREAWARARAADAAERTARRAEEEKNAPPVASSYEPRVLSAIQLLALDHPDSSMMIDPILPFGGVIIVVGPKKDGKTVFSVQVGVAVATACALFDEFPILVDGPVLIVEVDDPSGEKSIKEYLAASPRFSDTHDWPIHIVTDCPHEFGQPFLDWLEGQIVRLGLKLVVLDSYTALRPSRPRGVDIVKVERDELAQMDALAKKHACTFMVIHHPSKGASGLDWSDAAAGTYAIGAAAEGQIHISRFRDLSLTAPERLVRARGRHYEGFEGVLRFRRDTLDYELVMRGAASSMRIPGQGERDSGVNAKTIPG